MTTGGLETDLSVLRHAFHEGRLVLYLGAGVSVGSELPKWEHLVAAMYYSALTTDHAQREITRAYRNYLLAISKWYLEQGHGAIDVTARKIRAFYDREGRQAEFREHLRTTLYTAMLGPFGDTDESRVELLERNKTLGAIRDLCTESKQGVKGVQAIITYNYDDLVEQVLPRRTPATAVWRAKTRIPPSRLPIYHVHGYVPYRETARRSRASEIIFSEEQFNAAANDPYHWANIIQIRYMTGYVGLAIGLSMSDRNMRRLLDAVRSTPMPPTIYAVLKPDPTPKFLKRDNAQISRWAAKYRRQFSRMAGEKTKADEFDQVRAIIDAVHREDVKISGEVLGGLGVRTLPVDDYSEIADVIVPAILR